MKAEDQTAAQVDDKNSGNGHSPHLFTILVNNKAFQTPAHTLSGDEIKALGGVPADYELFQVRGKDTVPVPGGETIHIHEKLEFRAIPAGTFGRG